MLDETIYETAIALEVPHSETQVPVELSFGGFHKLYFIDLLVAGGALFELKAVEQLHPRHRAQVLNYLHLAELSHAKLINLRTDRIEHEFINTNLTRSDRQRFAVDATEWRLAGPSCIRLEEIVVALLRDWGTGLEMEAYLDCVTHLLGGAEQVLCDTPIQTGGRRVGTQRLLLCTPDSAVKITGFEDARQPIFEDHARRLLAHTPLRRIQWINITNGKVAFRTLE